jgi:hypothetical protein
MGELGSKGYIAPFVLSVYEPDTLLGMPKYPEKLKQYGVRDMILIAFWRTNCVTPRIDILLMDYETHETVDTVIRLQHACASFLKARFCNPDKVINHEKMAR